MLDYEALPLRTAAALFSGLRDDARVKMKLTGTSLSVDRLLRAVIADRLGFLVWAKTADAKHGRNRPASIAAQLMGEANSDSKVRAFRDGAAFERERARIIEEARAWQD